MMGTLSQDAGFIAVARIPVQGWLLEVWRNQPPTLSEVEMPHLPWPTRKRYRMAHGGGRSGAHNRLSHGNSLTDCCKRGSREHAVYQGNKRCIIRG